MIVARILAPLATIAALTFPAQAQVEIQEVTSPGGIDAWLVQDNSIPFLAIEMWFGGGASLDSAETAGATNLMMGLLEEGSGDLDETEFATALEGLAASFDFDTYRDEVVVSATILTQNRDEVLALLRQALVEPTFSESAFARVQQQVVSSLEYDGNDPDRLAGWAFNEMAYGDHPYAVPSDGTLDSVAALTRDDMVAAHRAALVRDRVSVGVAGDITPEELGPLLDALLGDLPLSESPLPGPAEVALEAGVTVIDFATPQSSVYFGHTGIARDDPDFFPAFVLNQVLGAGGYRSRLMREVREERGLTYGVSTWLSLNRGAPMIQGGFSSSNALVAEAVDVIRSEWALMAEEGISEEELAAAQRYLTGAYPLRFDGNGQIAGILAAMQSDDMPVDYINTRNDNVMAVTVDDIARVAERLIDPDSLRFVVVGQPEGFDAAN
ncbi:pitrilysin family protein [Hasllibacter sp. MH4015]|uniref:M16 family metallopeptidase n=1 Tax=Hasllibacter sp. MH4015 TaxID=2854029 RepID=UPI001CD8176F|nr:pitrilysin family protein [Hasllibacter sp. MH4015]